MPRSALFAFLLVLAVLSFTLLPNLTDRPSVRLPANAQDIIHRCAALNAQAGPAADFFLRKVSDRFENGTVATWIRNATIWTGARNGTEHVEGDLLLDGGIVKALGYVPREHIAALEMAGTTVHVVDAHGAFVTPGLVDLHSHVGLLSAPFLGGAFDVNSPKGPVLPYLRSIDGFNTHDDAFQLSIAGGVTTAQVLPGSGNAIGGQAFMMKLRKTSDRSPSSMILEPPYSLNGSVPDTSALHTPRWRHMKQACGENLWHYGTRMDAIWAFRQAYDAARKVRDAQDAYCARAENGLWNELDGAFPESLQWEMLVDVLRGRVKISNHCYEAVDLDDIVRLTNEFKFPIASFHHASEAWLVPDVLKRTWGGTPSVAIFSTNHRYKRESFRGSEFAPRVLADNGIPVVMKTDHPVINGRDLLSQAQQAHYFGLPASLALASVTSVPAAAAGVAHRVGVLGEGTDADVVIWDSHPLHIGATPRFVWIDGVPQIPVPSAAPVVVGCGKDGAAWRRAPAVPDWAEETRRAVEWEGLPPFESTKHEGRVVFWNVSQVWARVPGGGVREKFRAYSEDDLATVVVHFGQITCLESGPDACPELTYLVTDTVTRDLRGGAIVPGLMSFGSPLGLEEIAGELSTGDGALYNAFAANVPGILRDAAGLVRAVDALQFGTRNALTAHRAGITTATSSLAKTSLFGGHNGVFGGLSTTFRTGAAHALEDAAIVQDVTAVHVAIGRTAPFRGVPAASVSEEIATLRRLLLEGESKQTETGYWFRKAAQGVIPLVIDVGSADIMLTLIELKREIEEGRGTYVQMVFARATEAHLIAGEIAFNRVGVILTPSRPFPETWDDRRILAGPPLTNDTALVTLLEHGVTVAVGVREAWDARNAWFDISWAARASNGRISEREAYSLASANLEKLLLVHADAEFADLVAFEGGSPFELSSKAVAVLSPERTLTELF